MTGEQNPALSERQIERAAHELASQERYNPSWCKPGKHAGEEDDMGLYRQRARMILEAAQNG